MNSYGRLLASALADAMLGGAWNRPALRERCGELLGRKPRWLGPVISSVLLAHPKAPRDGPRELAAFIISLDRFAESVHSRRPPVVGDRPVRPTAVVRMRWDTPLLHDVHRLGSFLGLSDGQLDWYADRRSLNRRAPSDRLRHYRYAWVGSRLIEAPKPRLLSSQRRLLDQVLGRIPVHEAVHGFVPGRGVHTFAAPHAGAPVVVRIDLISFFASITAARVYGLLRAAGFPEPVAHTLAAFCTTRTPARVLSAAPPWLPQRPYRLALLRGAHLPQGAPTSPALANLCGHRLDRRLAGLASAFDARYTRYADDLAFSGDLSPARISGLVRQVDTIASQEGFRVHPAKLRVRGRSDRQLLAGLVVNERPAVPREEYDRLRAILHDAARNGLDAANRAGHPDFPGYLAGRVNWVGQGRPARAAKLAGLLDAALHRP
jgi:RNA-directed DNA polymerase